MTDDDRIERDPRADLPGLTVLLQRPDITEATDLAGHDRVVAALREVLAEARNAVAAGATAPGADGVAAEAIAMLESQSTRGLRAVVNATGVLL
ncbi:MAG: hypothetical protein LC679_17405, partial [Intrasporangiaceae bacterium]|nr:hypothetical protein [Intrasporangiaceae bacterium]